MIDEKYDANKANENEKHMQQLQKTIKRKKPRVGKEKEKTLIE